MNERKMKNNDITKSFREDHLKPQRKIPIKSFFLFLGVGIFMSMLFWIESRMSFSSYILSDLGLSLLFLTLIFSITIPLFLYYNYWSTYTDSFPKYVSWDEEGIYLINRRDKEEFIPWSYVDEIGKLSRVSRELSHISDYYLERKGRIANNRFLSEEIGKQIKEKYETLKNERKIPPANLSFYETAGFRIFLLGAVIMAIIFFIMVIYPFFILGVY